LGVSRSDDLVDPERNTKKLASKLKELGDDVTLKEYTNTSHTTIMGAFARPLRFIAPVLDDVVAFISNS
jgi:hypothetical protein